MHIAEENLKLQTFDGFLIKVSQRQKSARKYHVWYVYVRYYFGNI